MPELVTRSIPPSANYPGLIAHGDPEGFEIVVIGSGDEAEEVLRRAVEERMGL